MATKIAPRIAVVGAGMGGLALAGILSRKLPYARLDVLERACKDRDEGYGLDLDEWGQETLVRAGVFDKFWSVSRPRSDLFRVYPLRGDEPLFVKQDAQMIEPALAVWVLAISPQARPAFDIDRL